MKESEIRSKIALGCSLYDFERGKEILAKKAYESDPFQSFAPRNGSEKQSKKAEGKRKNVKYLAMDEISDFVKKEIYNLYVFGKCFKEIFETYGKKHKVSKESIKTICKREDARIKGFRNINDKDKSRIRQLKFNYQNIAQILRYNFSFEVFPQQIIDYYNELPKANKYTHKEG